MPLADEVIARVSVQRLVELTNPEQSAATVRDDVRLGLACTDTIADFELYTGKPFDIANAIHLSAAILGVICRLKRISMEPAAFESQECTGWMAALAIIRLGKGAPGSNSNLKPTRERPGTVPDFDRSRFGDQIPTQQLGSDRDATREPF